MVRSWQVKEAHMALRELARADWQSTMDNVSRSLGAKRVKIEVTGLGLGDQIAANQIELKGLSYDPHDDTLTVFAEGLQHRVRHPRSVHIDHDLDLLHSLEAIDREGNHHIIQLSEPLSLPPPG
jgi:hypothetical protein